MILVTGGTGTLGRLVVARLRDAGQEVRVLSRQHRDPGPGISYAVGDLRTGQGIDAALVGVQTIVHCASDRTGDPDAARNLVRSATARGDVPPHLVYISIVGVDRILVVSAVDRALFGYYRAKLETEQVISESGLPWTTLRTTQFHELILAGARALARSPVVPNPSGFHFQPIDADEVAARLVELALGEPAGRVADMGGPQVLAANVLLRSYLRAAGRRRVLLPVWLPGNAARSYQAGANLAPDQAVGRRTFKEFLAARSPL